MSNMSNMPLRGIKLIGYKVNTQNCWDNVEQKYFYTLQYMLGHIPLIFYPFSKFLSVTKFEIETVYEVIQF